MKFRNFACRTIKTLAVILLLGLGVSAAAKTKFRVLYNFKDGSDGAYPVPLAPLAIDARGNLFGGAEAGGDNKNSYCEGYGCGVIFELSLSDGGKWKERVLFEITNPVGQGEFDSPLALDGQGNLYGCDNPEPMFELTPSSPQWTFDPIWPGGCIGPVGLILDAAGNLYGEFGNDTTGGISELSPTSNGWVYTNLYDFCPSGWNCRDGDEPLAPFSWDTKGNLYGTTWSGGLVGCGSYCGVAFQMTPHGDGTWTYHVMHRFDSFKGDGYLPYGSITVDGNGGAYGTTTHGGPNGGGTVFKLTPAGKGRWKETQIYTFPNGDYGTGPGGNLLFDKAGNLYGTAGSFLYCNGACGLVFKLTPRKNGKWNYTVVHHFNMTDGDYPNGLTMDSQGNLYGTTTHGGKYGYGVVWEITP